MLHGHEMYIYYKNIVDKCYLDTALDPYFIFEFKPTANQLKYLQQLFKVVV